MNSLRNRLENDGIYIFFFFLGSFFFYFVEVFKEQEQKADAYVQKSLSLLIQVTTTKALCRIN